MNPESKPPVASGETKSDVDAFLEAAHDVARSEATPAGRLIFALDVTMSRQATWTWRNRCKGACLRRRKKSAGSMFSSSISAATANTAWRLAFGDGDGAWRQAESRRHGGIGGG